MSPSVSSRGFTLVEVLVALVVTALLLSLVMNGAILAKTRETAALQKSEAVFLARSLLAEASIEPFKRGERAGIDGDLRWRLRETPLQRDPRKRFVLSRLSLEISDARGASVAAFETRRIKVWPRS